MVTNRDMKSFGSRRKEKFQKLLRRLTPLTFLIHVQAFRDPLRWGFRVSKSSWMMDPTRSREMPSCSATDLAEIRRSSKMSSWIWSILSGVVTCFGSSRTRHITGGKIITFKLGHPGLTVAYGGACSPNISVRMAWISLCALPCRGKKTWWQLVSPCCWNRARRLTCFLSASVIKKKTYNSAHEQTLLSKKLSIPSYDIGK